MLQRLKLSKTLTQSCRSIFYKSIAASFCRFFFWLGSSEWIHNHTHLAEEFCDVSGLDLIILLIVPQFVVHYCCLKVFLAVLKIRPEREGATEQIANKNELREALLSFDAGVILVIVLKPFPWLSGQVTAAAQFT